MLETILAYTEKDIHSFSEEKAKVVQDEIETLLKDNSLSEEGREGLLMQSKYVYKQCQILFNVNKGAMRDW